MSIAPTRRNGVARATAVQVFHALSDETRLAVIEMLCGGERCVCDLQDAVGAAQSRLSFHLKVLKDAGLVTDRKEGRWSYYALNAERLAEATTALGVLATPPTGRAPALKLYALDRAPGSGGSTAAPAAARRARSRPSVKQTGGGCC
jgi:ArsR family transcriptional regulator, arsenate/arsenite/antimonite-responsive transcriptional repressor